MKRLPWFAFLLAVCALTIPARADQDATYAGSLSPAEQAFVADASAYLNAHFPTVESAERAGYVRYTNEDETGAISYANRQWLSTDSHHPSQLWYDKSGRLLGADYSVLVGGNPGRPQLWGINPGRWVEFDGHVHWVARDPATGRLTYDQWARDATFAAAGGDPERPTAATLVAMKKVAGADEVVTIFHFPAIWDLSVWATPNPDGPFAWKNPLVTP